MKILYFSCHRRVKEKKSLNINMLSLINYYYRSSAVHYIIAKYIFKPAAERIRAKYIFFRLLLRQNM